MSNIYVLEPPTNGKVVLETSVGPIEIELWSKEAPKACRNFVQHCLDGYYNKTVFHRIIKGFLVQGGDPSGSGEGGESIYGKPFKDEFHSRLRFVRRGLVAMASSEPDDNRSQFFFTLDKCTELNNKNTIFGKVVGDTVYNMLSLSEAQVDFNDRPYHPQKILKVQVLNNPFPDVVPRVKQVEEPKKKKGEKTSSAKATKNFTLLSFGEEAMEEDEELQEVTKKLEHGKGKSSHDLTNDPKLLNAPAVEKSVGKLGNSEELENTSDTTAVSNRVAGALKRAVEEKASNSKKKKQKTRESSSEEDDTPDDGRKAVQEEILKLKKELTKKPDEDNSTDSTAKDEERTSALASWAEERARYRDQSQNQGSLLKGSDREKATLEMLSKFQSKLRAVTTKLVDFDDDDEDDSDDGGDDEVSWMRQKLVFRNEDDEEIKRLATHETKVIDVTGTKVDEERFSIMDPRNPLNMRRREASHSEGGRSKRSK